MMYFFIQPGEDFRAGRWWWEQIGVVTKTPSSVAWLPDDNKVKNIITLFNLNLLNSMIFIESSTLFIANLATFTAKCN